MLQKDFHMWKKILDFSETFSHGKNSVYRRKRPLKRTIYRWEDNANMDLIDISYEGMGWIQVAQDMVQQQAHVNMEMNFWVL